MKAILITYDLNQPGQNYKKVHEAIKAFGTWCHPVDSTWIVVTQKTAAQVWDQISSSFDRNDSCLTVDVTGDSYSGWLPKEVWDWLAQHLRQTAWR